MITVLTTSWLRLRWPLLAAFGVFLLLCTSAAAPKDDGHSTPTPASGHTPPTATPVPVPHKTLDAKESDAAATPGFTYFAQTGHSVSGPLLTFYTKTGGLTRHGLPLTEVVLTSGRYLQFFERSVIEIHPDQADTAGEFTLVNLPINNHDPAPGRTYAVTRIATYLMTAQTREDLMAARQIHVPSLMFHYVRVVSNPKDDPLGFNLSVTPANFVRFLDWLDENGYTTVTIGQIADHLRYGTALPPRAVSLRFDDGYESHWFAYQEMHKRHMTATFFVISQWLHLSVAQWQQIDADGFEVAPHTRHHVDLQGLTPAQQVTEIAGSKKDLEAMLGHPVRTFAYPYGSYNDSAVQAVLDAGFTIAVTTEGGYTWRNTAMLLEPTVSMRGDESVADLIATVQNKTNEFDTSNFVPRFASTLADLTASSSPTSAATATPARDGSHVSSSGPGAKPPSAALLDIATKPFDTEAQAVEVERRWLRLEAQGGLTHIPANTEPSAKNP